MVEAEPGPGNGKCCFCCQPSDQVCPHCGLVYFCCEDHLFIHRPEDFCFPFRVEANEAVGRFIVATRDIKPTGTRRVLTLIRLNRK